MDIALTPRLEELIRERLDTGLYESESEVGREALRLLVARDAYELAACRSFQEDVAAGIAELEAGLDEPLDMESIKAVARAEANARRENPVSLALPPIVLRGPTHF